MTGPILPESRWALLGMLVLYYVVKYWKYWMVVLATIGLFLYLK